MIHKATLMSQIIMNADLICNIEIFAKISQNNVNRAAYLSVVAVNVDTHSDLRLDCQPNDILSSGNTQKSPGQRVGMTSRLLG